MDEDLKQKARIWFENKYGNAPWVNGVLKEAFFEVFLEGFEAALWTVGWYGGEGD